MAEHTLDPMQQRKLIAFAELELMKERRDKLARDNAAMLEALEEVLGHERMGCQGCSDSYDTARAAISKARKES